MSDVDAEWDTAETIEAVREALAAVHNVTPVEADEQFYPTVAALRPDIVFNVAEGMNGVSREAQVPAMLDFLGIPYSGSDPLTLAICLDKARAKEILSYHGIRTPKFTVLTSPTDPLPAGFGFPAIVKPLHEGSSKGIFDSSLVRTAQEMRAAVDRVLLSYNEPALIEEFLPGREFTVAILGNAGIGAGPVVLPIVEISFDTLPAGVNRIYSYEAKWLWDTTDNPLDIYSCPAKLEPRLESAIGEICLKAAQVMRCRDWCRIDVRLDASGAPNIIEINPIPGILPDPRDNSCLPKAARTAGLEYDSLIRTVLACAAVRHGIAR